jgi:hypothetical protein
MPFDARTCRSLHHQSLHGEAADNLSLSVFPRHCAESLRPLAHSQKTCKATELDSQNRHDDHEAAVVNPGSFIASALHVASTRQLTRPGVRRQSARLVLRRDRGLQNLHGHHRSRPRQRRVAFRSLMFPHTASATTPTTVAKTTGQGRTCISARIGNGLDVMVRAPAGRA